MQRGDEDMTAQHLAGLAASASAIRAIIAAGERSADATDAVMRNADHIAVACGYEAVIESGADLSDFIAAQREGLEWLHV